MNVRVSLFVLLVLVLNTDYLSLGQQIRRKPMRAAPPKFSGQEFEGVFFEDVQKQLVGKPPTLGELASSSTSQPNSSGSTLTSEPSANGATNVWKQRISAQAIEDLVKEGKRRLDTIVTTPAKFSGGSYKDARREFTLQAILFATIELYPDKIRWQSSASLARGKFSRIAANAKVATTPAYNEAKLRMEDLATLLKGSPLSDTVPPPELNWQEISDRVPSMQILEWALRENLNRYVASEAEFKSHTDETLMYAELIGLLGETLLQKGMTDADDDEYKSWARKMIQESTRVTEAVKLTNPTMAREAAGQLDQACNACHNTFR